MQMQTISQYSMLRKRGKLWNGRLEEVGILADFPKLPGPRSSEPSTTSETCSSSFQTPWTSGATIYLLYLGFSIFRREQTISFKCESMNFPFYVMFCLEFRWYWGVRDRSLLVSNFYRFFLGWSLIYEQEQFSQDFRHSGFKRF